MNFVATIILAFLPLGQQTAEPPVSIDGLAAQLTQLRAQKAELAKKETSLIADILAAIKGQLDVLAKLGIKIDGVPVIPPVIPPDVPPVPPTPVPPVPVDAFAVELKALFPAPPSIMNKAQALVLAAVYRGAAKEAMSATNTTFGDLLAIITAAIDGAEGLGPTVLKPVRERVRVELQKAAPNLDAELIDGTRRVVADVYTRAAVAMEGCAK